MADPLSTTPIRIASIERDDPWLSLSRWLWLVFAVAISVKTIANPEVHTVYTAFSGASRDWWANHSLYEERAYYYSPTFAVALTPLAIWSDLIGGILWGLLSLGLLWVSLRRFYHEVLPSAGWKATAEGKFLMIALVGSVRSFWSGQSNALLIAMVLLGAVAIVRQRWWRASWWLAAPVHIKVWPLAVVGLLGAQWPKRLAGRVTIAIIGLGLMPLLTKPLDVVVDQYVGWYRCLFQRQAGVVRFTGYRDAWTIWEKLFTPVNSHHYMLAQACGGLAALGWCLWAKHRGATIKQQLVLTLGAWSCWQLLLGPGTERLTYVLIAPSLAWAVLASYEARLGRTWATLALVTTYVFDISSFERMLSPHWPAVFIVQPCGVLLFASWLSVYGRRAELWTSVRSAEQPAVQEGEESHELAADAVLTFPLNAWLPGQQRVAPGTGTLRRAA